MYLLRPSLLDGLLAGDQPAVCHAGHGVNSYAITYGLALVCVESRLRGQSPCGWHPEIVPVAPGTALTTALDLLA